MRQPPHVVLLFLDGVGIGRKDGRRNPFFRAKLPVLTSAAGGAIPSLRDARRRTERSSLVPVSATLGVPGLPQSGTGQTALLTGVNAPRIVGKHFGPHPYSSLRAVLAEKSIFRQLELRGRRCFYANAFPRQYFEYLSSGRNRTTAIAMAWTLAGHELNTAVSLAAGTALSPDITNERWKKMGYDDIRPILPQEAGRRLASISENYDFVLFEYFFTDHAGHSRSMQDAVEILQRIDLFLEGFFRHADPGKTLFILTSDHGNLEDLSVKTHTRNPVPLLAVGPGHREITANARNLTDVTPGILKLLS
jgi:2,3-bisphosphoglycerate-independent phosphoglycerate mutase